jgi:hypothetical protein
MPIALMNDADSDGKLPLGFPGSPKKAPKSVSPLVIPLLVDCCAAQEVAAPPVLEQVQLHDPAVVFVTVDAVPVLHRLVVGALLSVCPFEEPQTPLTAVELQTAGPAFVVVVLAEPRAV